MRQANIITSLFVFTFFILFLYLMQVYGDCSTVKNEVNACSAYNFIKDFKELFGWIVAVSAALLAAEPVWRQLNLMKTDDIIKSISFLRDEALGLKDVRFNSERNLALLWRGFLVRSDHGDEFHWVGSPDDSNQMRIKLDSAISKLETLNASARGRQSDVFKRFLRTMNDLSSCLFDINATENAELDEVYKVMSDFELKLSEKRASENIDEKVTLFYREMNFYLEFLEKEIFSIEKLIAKKRDYLIGGIK